MSPRPSCEPTKAPFPALFRGAAVVAAGALALGLGSCAGAPTRPPAPEATAPEAMSAPEVEVEVAPEAPPEATVAEAAEPAPAKTVFYVNRSFKENRQLVLTRVTKGAEGLRLDFVFTNKGSTTRTIELSPANDVNAMFVELLDGRQLAFKSAEGISFKPTRDRVEPGEKQRFSVTFEPLPEGVTTFHVYEGLGAKRALPGQSEYWYFRDIRLK